MGAFPWELLNSSSESCRLMSLWSIYGLWITLEWRLHCWFELTNWHVTCNWLCVWVHPDALSVCEAVLLELEWLKSFEKLHDAWSHTIAIATVTRPEAANLVPNTIVSATAAWDDKHPLDAEVPLCFPWFVGLLVLSELQSCWAATHNKCSVWQVLLHSITGCWVKSAQWLISAFPLHAIDWWWDSSVVIVWAATLQHLVEPFILSIHICKAPPCTCWWHCIVVQCFRMVNSQHCGGLRACMPLYAVICWRVAFDCEWQPLSVFANHFKLLFTIGWLPPFGDENEGVDWVIGYVTALSVLASRWELMSVREVWFNVWQHLWFNVTSINCKRFAPLSCCVDVTE